MRNSRERNGKERILDAAEQLFAQRGLYGVSLRDITRAAGVDVVRGVGSRRVSSRVLTNGDRCDWPTVATTVKSTARR